MGVNILILLCLTLHTNFQLVNSQDDLSSYSEPTCTLEGYRFNADRRGQLPFETYISYSEFECQYGCEARIACVIWQWQPTRNLCWMMNLEPYEDPNSDFGINNCNKGKPTENAPLCEVTKGDRNNIWTDYAGVTKEECLTKCDSDCLIWQYIKNRNLCRIHKLEVDTTKQSHVGIHYCRDATASALSSTRTQSTSGTDDCSGIDGCPGALLPAVRANQQVGGANQTAIVANRQIRPALGLRCPHERFFKKHMCNGCPNVATALQKKNKYWTSDIVTMFYNRNNIVRTDPRWTWQANGDCVITAQIDIVWKCTRIAYMTYSCRSDGVNQMCTITHNPGEYGHFNSHSAYTNCQPMNG